jgi:hypothetical protein
MGMTRRIALAVVKGARQNVGVLESGVNAGKYVEAYQKSCVPVLSAGDPWCAAFVVYRFIGAAGALGEKLPVGFPRSGYTPDWKLYAKKTGTWLPMPIAKAFDERPRPGDLALFYFKNLKRIAHIGIVVEVHDWGVVTVEGNTGPEVGSIVERNGDGVYLKRREWHELGAFGGFMKVDF